MSCSEVAQCSGRNLACLTLNEADWLETVTWEELSHSHYSQQAPCNTELSSPGSSTKFNWLLLTLWDWNQAAATKRTGSIRRTVQSPGRLTGGCQHSGHLICEGDGKPDKHRQPTTLQQLVCGCCSSRSIRFFVFFFFIFSLDRMQSLRSFAGFASIT